VIDESELQYEKQDDPRISIWLGISTFDDFERLWLNLWWTTSRRKSFSITKISFLDSIEIDDKVRTLKSEGDLSREYYEWDALCIELI
jgi:hypothetical protein